MLERSAPLESIVRRAMDPDPSLRPADGRELAAQLARVQGATADALPPEERTLLHAAALLHTLATAATLWAIVQSLTPRVLRTEEVGPLVMVAPDALPDGRVVSMARFETWPILVAVAAGVIALGGHALLRRHWRLAGLDAPRPSTSVPAARMVLVLGAMSAGLFALRLAFGGGSRASVYVPLVGGLMELAIVFLAWTCVLEAWRVERPLATLRALWGGVLLALVPPVVELVRYLARWRA